MIFILFKVINKTKDIYFGTPTGINNGNSITKIISRHSHLCRNSVSRRWEWKSKVTRVIRCPISRLVLSVFVAIGAISLKKVLVWRFNELWDQCISYVWPFGLYLIIKRNLLLSLKTFLCCRMQLPFWLDFKEY